MKTIRFDHEKLAVYQRSLRFITWLTEILERVPPKLSAHGQLDRASTSIPLNVAEGNGSKIKNTAAPLLIFLLLLICPAMPAQDWPRWGGNDPGRNMYSPAKGLPDRFDPGKPKSGTEDIDLQTTKNVKWVAKLGSQAYGNVVVAGGKVFIGTNNENPRDPQHEGDRSILLCLDEKTGEFLWQLVVPKLASGKVNDWEGLGLLSSRCVEGNRVHLVTTHREVICLDTEGMATGNDGPFMDEAKYVVKDTGKPPAKIGPKDADIIWKHDMQDALGVF